MTHIVRLTFLAVLFFSVGVHAADFSITVKEQKTAKTSVFTVDTEGRRIPGARSTDSMLPSTDSFSIQDRHLIYANRPIAAADELLAQGTDEGIQIAVVRQEYNSLSNPLRLLSAFSGHPVQVSKITLIAIRNSRVAWEKELTHEPSSYTWSAWLSH